MAVPDTPIRRRLMAMILLTSSTVLLLICAAFFTYEFLTFRQSTIAHLTTLGDVIADNSTAALAFANADDAREVLSALRAERHIVAAGLYDRNGKLFAKYPNALADRDLPVAPGQLGFSFTGGHLVGFQPVAQTGNRNLGSLYLKSDMGAMYERFRSYGAIATLAIAGSFLVAYLISRSLQRRISQPILALTQTARAVSDRGDYSVRAASGGRDELGLLATAFNHMLTRIQDQHRELGESAARLRAVLNSALSAVVVIDSQGVILDWNERAEKMFGWPREKSLGRTLAELIIPERYREAHRSGLERYLASGGSPVLNRLIELSAVRHDGEEFPIELSVNAMVTDEVPTFCGFITDITERKHAQAKLQAQLGRLELMHRITRAVGERQDLPSVFQVVIRSLEQDLPIDFGCICLYEPIAEILTIASVGAKSPALAQELASDEKVRIAVDQSGLAHSVRGHLVYEPDIRGESVEFPQRLARDGLRAMVIAPLRTESTVFGVLIAARRAEGSFSSADCEFLRQLSEHVALASHQVQLYNALQRAYEEMRQTQHAVMQQERLRALGQMASGIAHDINNAISPVALYTESLLEREPNLSTRARDYLVTIQRAIEDVAETVARMREFYRPREPQLQLARVGVNDLAKQVIDLTRARWSDMPQQRGVVIELKTDFAADLPGIMGAETEIRDALTNLIFNAVDAMPEGGVLSLRTKVIESPRGDGESARHVCVEVQDTGTGMDEETRRRCLEPFFTTKGERGTGLGLAMVYGMVQRHSAELEIDSAAGQGTTMRFVFPVSVPVFAATERLAASLTQARRLRILVVDDDPLLIKSLGDTLESDGHAVTLADGGQAGIDAFLAAEKRGEPFAVVITDLGMPYVDGRKVAATIRAAAPLTPILLLTGWGQRLVAEDDVPPHVSRVLNKPPRLHELRSALAEFTTSEAELTH